MSTLEKQVTCRRCGKSFFPSFEHDFYPDGDDPAIGQCERCLMNSFFGSKTIRHPQRLSMAQAEALCRPGKGSQTCCFVLLNNGGYECAKGSCFEHALRARLAKDEPGTEDAMVSRSDNCSGPPDFRPTPSTENRGRTD